MTSKQHLRSLEKKIDNYEYYESKMNNDIKYNFMVIESISTFNHKCFLEQIKNEMKFYEMNIESLSKSCNISNFRLSALINRNAKFEYNEITTIKRRLHIK